MLIEEGVQLAFTEILLVREQFGELLAPLLCYPQLLQDFRLTHPTCVIESQDPGSHSRPKLPLVACRKIGLTRLLSTGRGVVLFAELDILCAQVNVLHADFFVAFELRIWGHSFFSNLHYLDPIYLNLRLLLGFM